MVRFNKKFILVILLSGIFLLAGCDKFSFGIFDESDKKINTEITETPDDKGKEEGNKKDNNDDNEATPDPVNSVTNVSPLPTEQLKQAAANMDLQVYTVNAEDGNIEVVTSRIPEGIELTPELIVDTVIEVLADQSITIGKDSVTIEKDAVIVSFTKDNSPASNMGSGYEGSILDAFAYSLLDNTDCNKVIFRIEGQVYASGVYEMEVNEAYMER